MIRVHVPATSANLGVGYDCLGMALSLYGTFTFDFACDTVVVRGCPPQYQNADNLVLQAFFTTLQELNVPPVQGVALTIDTPLPLARGLGSSASCIVAGVLAGAAYAKQTLSKQALLRICLLLEHHPDNVAPALYGGLCASFIEGCDPYIAAYSVSEHFRFITVIPDYEVRTQQARAILPDTMSYGDATYQMGRCAALCKALESGDGELLSHACSDRMQEPYRKKLIPDYDAVRKIAFAQGADAFFISGSGSTMIAVIDQHQALALCDRLCRAYPKWQIYSLCAAKQGGYVEDE